MVSVANMDPTFLKADQAAADVTAVDWLTCESVNVKNDMNAASVEYAGEVPLVKTVKQGLAGV
jgi:hypothetical protein